MRPIGGPLHQLFDGARCPRVVRRSLKRGKRPRRALAREIHLDSPTLQEIADDLHMVDYALSLALDEQEERDRQAEIEEDTRWREAEAREELEQQFLRALLADARREELGQLDFMEDE